MHSRSYCPAAYPAQRACRRVRGRHGACCSSVRLRSRSAATPAALTEAIRSQTREEFRAEIEEEFGYTEAATPGGSFIDSNVNDIQTIHPSACRRRRLHCGVVGSSTTGSSAATSAPDSRRRPAWPTIGRLPRTASLTPFTSTRTRSGTTGTTSLPRTFSSPSMLSPIRRSARPTRRPSSTLLSPGA